MRKKFRRICRAMVRLAIVICLGTVAMASGAAQANPKPANPVVLEITDHDIYINLGHESGLALGSFVILEHVISAPHPVTGEVVRDTFPLGTMEVVKVGAKTSIVRADVAFFHRVRVGDEVSLASKAVVYVDPWTVPVKSPGIGTQAQARRYHEAETERATARVAEDERAHAAWQACLGQPLETRLRIWQSFATEHPESNYRAFVELNVRELRARIEAERAQNELTPQDRASATAMRRLGILTQRDVKTASLVQEGPLRGYEGEALPVALLMAYPHSVSQAWLYVRSADEASFEVLSLGKDGDGYLRAEIPAEMVTAPGVEYFVETLAVGGEQPVPALGRPTEPKRIAVDASVREEPPTSPGHSRVTLFTDYVDFDGPSTSYDQYLHAEVDFMYRFFRPIYSLRLGFGTMSGQGGPKDVIDLGEGCTLDGEFLCRRIGYNYAFTEIEQRMTDLFAVMLRVQWGSAFQDQDPVEGVDREFFDAFGARARIRLGREEASNLVLGAATTQRLGVMFEGAFTWDVIPRFPVVLAVQVTDQPVLEDMGVRLISDIGWRHFDWVYPSLRIAYQARDIDHAGLSAGFAANFDW